MLTTLASELSPIVPKDIIPIVAITFGGLIAIVAVVGGLIKNTIVGQARERSRREIAAYIAEGSMTADEGERLLQAGRASSCGKKF
jgi:hypothetical protein